MFSSDDVEVVEVDDVNKDDGVEDATAGDGTAVGSVEK